MFAPHLLSAPAKLNLSLRVGGRNDANGLHTIESQVVFLDLHDRLEVYEREDSGGLVVDFCKAHFARDPSVRDSFLHDSFLKESFPVCEDHSLSRAARALAAAVGAKSIEDLGLSWNVVVRKAIPAGAGLGGGSSDAASFLRYARDRLGTRGLTISEDGWLSVARAVGSDVALFFLRARSNRVFVSGFGERVAEQDALPVCGVVLLCGAGLSTKAVYARHACNRSEGVKDTDKADAEREEEACLLSSSLPSPRLEALLEEGNDLLVAACALDGSIVERLSALRSCEEVFCARMTGSGSACFGLTELGCEEGVAASLRARGFRGVLATRFLRCEAGEGVDKAKGEVLE